MKIQKSLSIAAAVITFVLQASCAPPAHETSSTEPKAEALELSDVVQSIGGDEIAVDAPALIAKFAQAAEEKRGLRLPLPEGREIVIITDRWERVSAIEALASGSVEGFAESEMSFSIQGDAVVAHVSIDDRIYEIRPGESGRHLITRENVRSLSCDPVVSEEPTADANVIDAKDVSPLAMPVIDVLAVYTPNARRKMGGTNGIQALIKKGIADTNRAYSESGVSLSVRLVGMKELSTNESSNYLTDLRALQSKYDGRWDDVHALRMRVRADQVSLVGAYDGVTYAGGIGNMNVSYSSAFTVTPTWAFSQYTFAHELGHNLGLNHFDGYVSSSGRFRTIMAYPPATWYAPRIRRYSNPVLRYNGYLTGDVSHNEARILNRNGARVSNLISASSPVSIQAL